MRKTVPIRVLGIKEEYIPESVESDPEKRDYPDRGRRICSLYFPEKIGNQLKGPQGKSQGYDEAEPGEYQLKMKYPDKIQ